MKESETSPARLILISAVVAALLLFLARRPAVQAQVYRAVHLPTDWSQRHAIFSAPESVIQMWRVQSEPRYWHQRLRQNAPATRAAADREVRERDAHDDRDDDRDQHDRDRSTSKLHRDWSMSLGIGGTVGDEMYPAKFTFDVNATPSCTNDFVVFNTSLIGVAGVRSSVVAFNKLYSTQGGNCLGNAANGTGPQIMFSYNTNIDTSGIGLTTGTVTTSPVLTLDGSKVVYVESGALNGAILRILKWDTDDVATANPDQILAGGSSWSACTPPNSCLIGLAFSGNPQDTESSPFYVYGSDTLYVGDNSGKLHKFTGVFNGTPAEITTAPWPITLGVAALTSPVYDGVSGNIFVGDATGHVYYVKDLGSTSGVCSSGSNSGVVPCVGTTNGLAGGPTSIAMGGRIDDAPIVDSTTGRVFFFNGTVPNGAFCAGLGTNDAIVQTDTALANQVKVCINNGGGAVNTDMKSGAFDNAYLMSAAGSKTGKMYFCARGSSDTDLPALFRIGFNSVGVMSSAADAGSLASLTDSTGEECSPVTEIYNAASSTDWIFFSVGKSATLGGCAAAHIGCLMSINLTALGATWPPVAITNGFPLPASSTVPGNAGASGIIVDNVADTTTFPQASSIYFSFLSNSVAGRTCNGAIGVGCAVKLTQSALN